VHSVPQLSLKVEVLIGPVCDTEPALISGSVAMVLVGDAFFMIQVPGMCITELHSLNSLQRVLFYRLGWIDGRVGRELATPLLGKIYSGLNQGSGLVVFGYWDVRR